MFTSVKPIGASWFHALLNEAQQLFPMFHVVCRVELPNVGEVICVYIMRFRDFPVFMMRN